MIALAKAVPLRPAPVRPRARKTGCFASRRELTCQVWAMHRLQVVPNTLAIARACGISVTAVKTIIRSGEGLDDYLGSGCAGAG